MSLREELERVMGAVLIGNRRSVPRQDLEYSVRVANDFFRDHGQALLEAVEDAERFSGIMGLLDNPDVHRFYDKNENFKEFVPKCDYEKLKIRCFILSEGMNGAISVATSRLLDMENLKTDSTRYKFLRLEATSGGQFQVLQKSKSMMRLHLSADELDAAIDLARSKTVDGGGA